MEGDRERGIIREAVSVTRTGGVYERALAMDLESELWNG